MHCVKKCLLWRQVMILWWFGRSVTNCDPANVQELSKYHILALLASQSYMQVWFGIDTLSREYPLKCNVSLFIHRNIIEIFMTQDLCYQMDSAKNQYFFLLFHFKHTQVEQLEWKVPQWIFVWIQFQPEIFFWLWVSLFQFSLGWNILWEGLWTQIFFLQCSLYEQWWVEWS